MVANNLCMFNMLNVLKKCSNNILQMNISSFFWNGCTWLYDCLNIEQPIKFSRPIDHIYRKEKT